MGSIIKVNEYKDFGNNAIMTSDGAGVVTPNASGIKNTPAFFASQTVAQAVANTTVTQLQFNTEEFDTDSAYDTSTYKFTPQTAGKYSLFACVMFNTGTDFDQIECSIKKNGTIYSSNIFVNQNYNSSVVTTIVDMNGSSDYVEVYAYQNSGGSLNTYPDDGSGNYKYVRFSGYKLIGV